MRRVLAALLLSASVAVVAPPAFAASDLGGYSGSAEASIVRIGIYEPAIPIPAEPQVDASIGYARSTTANGPSARGLASYLWPGDAVGDGLGVLLGNEALDYPVKTSSSYPATDAGPARNAVQINDGNGMSTSADGSTTRATVVGLGLGNGIGGPGSGLCQLLKRCTSAPPNLDLPDPIAAAATIESLKSQSTVVLGRDDISATAHSVATGVSILGGLITVGMVDLRSQSRSDGSRATSRGSSVITGLRVLGHPVDLGAPVELDGSTPAAPRLPVALERLGISVRYLQSQRVQEGAAGSLRAEALTITLDVAPLRNLLRLGGLSDQVAPAFAQVDQVGPVLTGLLKLGTKIVVTLGDVRTQVTATPAYAASTGQVDPPASGSLGGQDRLSGGLAVPPAIAAEVVSDAGPAPLVTAAPASVDLPGLGRVPTWFVLVGLTLVGLVAWAIRGFGTWIFAGGSCPLGTSIGVPDLRKARSS